MQRVRFRQESTLTEDKYEGFLQYIVAKVELDPSVNTLQDAKNLIALIEATYNRANALDLAAVRVFAGGAGQMEEDSLLTEGLDTDASITRQYQDRQRQLPNVFTVFDTLDGEEINEEEAVRRRMRDNLKVQRQLNQYRTMRPSVEDAFLLALDYIESDADSGLGADIQRKLRSGVLSREEMARYLRRHDVTRVSFCRCAGACFSRIDGISRSRADVNIFSGKERYVHERRLAEAMLQALCSMSTPWDFWTDHVLLRGNENVDIRHRHHMTSKYLLDIVRLFNVYESLEFHPVYASLDGMLNEVIKTGNRDNPSQLDYAGQILFNGGSSSSPSDIGNAGGSENVAGTGPFAFEEGGSAASSNPPPLSRPPVRSEEQIRFQRAKTLMVLKVIDELNAIKQALQNLEARKIRLELQSRLIITKCLRNSTTPDAELVQVERDKNLISAEIEAAKRQLASVQEQYTVINNTRTLSDLSGASGVYNQPTAAPASAHSSSSSSSGSGSAPPSPGPSQPQPAPPFNPGPHASPSQAPPAPAPPPVQPAPPAPAPNVVQPDPPQPQPGQHFNPFPSIGPHQVPPAHAPAQSPAAGFGGDHPPVLAAAHDSCTLDDRRTSAALLRLMTTTKAVRQHQRDPGTH